MKQVKHEPVSYNNAIILSNSVIQCFYFEKGCMSFESFCKENIEKIPAVIIKPNKISLLHLFISWVNSNTYELKYIMNNLNIEDVEPHLEHIRSNLSEHGIVPEENIVPDFSIINNCNLCSECEQCIILDRYVHWLQTQENNLSPFIVHSTFQVLMLNKKFLRDLHERFAIFLKENGDKFHALYPKEISKEGVVSRAYWPAWLKRGVFFRDHGVCTICRADLTGAFNHGNHYELDHIVRLAKHGTNDSSNIQVLCQACNKKKLHHSSATSSFDIPIWNIDDRDISILLD